MRRPLLILSLLLSFSLISKEEEEVLQREEIPIGHSSWRCEMAERFGGSKATETAVDKALRWLAYHQEPDGNWNSRKYGATEKTDTAVTALALQAFLASGYTERRGQYRSQVQKAIAWLKSKQFDNGCIWDDTDAGGHRGVGYPHAMATLALTEAVRHSRVPDTRVGAQKAVEYCIAHQSLEGEGKGGWRYKMKEEGDLSVTGWYTLALRSAVNADMNVPPDSTIALNHFLKKLERPVQNADGAMKFWYTHRDEHAAVSHRLTAIGCFSRVLLGTKREDMEASASWMLKRGGLPEYGANGEKVDLYYWHWATLCLFQQGGENWNRWNESLTRVLLAKQGTQGDDTGSWAPCGEYSGEWGRVGQTALSTLCLEVYYRFPRMNPGDLGPALNADQIKTLQTLITKLGHDSFDEREKATRAIRDFGGGCRAALEEALKKNTDVEIRLRLQKLLELFPKF